MQKIRMSPAYNFLNTALTLERFDKKLNDLGLTHPSVMQLLEALKKVSQDYVDDLLLARRQTHHKVIHKEATIHKIPNNYAGWKVPKK